jgi:hypothetical protein
MISYPGFDIFNDIIIIGLNTRNNMITIEILLNINVNQLLS